MVDRVDAGGGEVGIAGEVEGAVDEAAGEAVGLGRVGPRQGGRLPPSPPAPPRRRARACRSGLMPARAMWGCRAR
ncbi:hypothetical protein SR39_06405 [Methylobacterium radiotolerans]|nr:hypothetical protein SR39_06405 [Methylobacterium radiotolerans]